MESLRLVFLWAQFKGHTALSCSKMMSDPPLSHHASSPEGVGHVGSLQLGNSISVYDFNTYKHGTDHNLQTFDILDICKWCYFWRAHSLALALLIKIGQVTVSRPCLYAQIPPVQNLGETEVACKISDHLDLNWQSYIH